MNFRLFPLSMVRGRNRGIKTRRRKYAAWYLFRVITECASYDKGFCTFHLPVIRSIFRFAIICMSINMFTFYMRVGINFCRLITIASNNKLECYYDGKKKEAR